GQVWAAQDERMRRDVAVKVVHPQYGMDEAETQARFQREVQLAGRLSHQNIVTVHDWGEVVVDGRRTLFLVMELVHGVPLHRRLVESTPAWPLAVGWGAQIAEALHAAHTESVVHRDIKPANVLLTPDGTVKVLDFGVAKFMGETIGARELTVTGVPLGSPPYMSPEQADGDRAIDHRSDLYSLGCLLYHAVTGRPPFTGSSQWAVLRKQMEAVPDPPGVYAEGLPSSLSDLILSLLAKRPEDRPADAAAVYEALSTLLADHVVTDPRGGTLDATQLGRTHSVSGKLLKRAWELFQWTEWNRATQREEAEAQLARARADAERLVNEASQQVAKMADSGRMLADSTVAQAITEAEELRVKSVKEAERIRAEARKDAVQRIEEAARTAAELLGKAHTDASEIHQTATTEAEKVRREAIDRATTLRRQAEVTLERTRTEAERLREEAREEARREAVRQIEEAARTAEELLDKAKADADEMRRLPMNPAEQVIAAKLGAPGADPVADEIARLARNGARLAQENQLMLKKLQEEERLEQLRKEVQRANSAQNGGQPGPPAEPA
uniref:serine/threonine-protein kinase n=1 Tax=Streptomyces sp. Agncl-13 TaxID=3400628 RepID=UPI003A8730B6